MRVLSAFAIAAMVAAAPVSATAAGSLEQTVKAVLAATHVPAAGAVVIKDARTAEIDVEGVRRIGGSDPVRVDDIWLIGSNGKPMTATMIARLVEHGTLSWTTPLSKYLPDLAAKIRPEYRAVTLDELLSHRSGLPHDASDTKFIDSFFDNHQPLPAQRLTYVARALQDAPVAPPGTKFSYSNTGLVLAAVIAERVTGVPYEDLMRREVFGPLGMTSAGFGPPNDKTLIGHRAGRVATPRDSGPLALDAAGILHMSLADWATFCADQLAGAQGRGKLLTAASYRLMQTAHAGTDVGLDWGVDPDVLGFKGPVLEHTGSDDNWYAIVLLFPQSGNGLLTIANAGQDMGGVTANKAMLKALLPMVSEKK